MTHEPARYALIRRTLPLAVCAALIGAAALAEGAGDADAVDPPSTTWRLIAVDGQPPVDDLGEVTFRADGAVSAATGCNRVNGMVAFQDGQISAPGPMIATRMACDPARSAQERRFMEALTGPSVVVFDPVAGVLTLTDPAGQTLGFTLLQ